MFGSAEVYITSYEYDVRWEYDDGKLTFTLYEKDGGLFAEKYGSIKYNVKVIDDDTIILSDDYGDKRKYVRKALGEVIGEKIGGAIIDVIT